MLDPVIRDLARGKNFGSISFHLPNGAIGTHVMWVDADDEHVLINTEVHRTKYKSIAANPNVTVTIWSSENTYSYAEVRGIVAGEVRGPVARAHIDALAQKYTGADYAADVVSERVILQISPIRQRRNGL
jgi:general stress protein 26